MNLARDIERLQNIPTTPRKVTPLRVYIAGPYTKGDTALNVREAIETAGKLLDAGFLPYCPHWKC